MKTSDDSRIAFPPDAFHVGWTILAAIGIAGLFGAGFIVAIAIWIAQHGMFTADVLRSLPFTMYLVNAQGIIEIVVVIYLAAVIPVVARTSLANLGFRMGNAGTVVIILIGVAAMFFLTIVVSGTLSTLSHYKSPEIAVALYLQLKGMQRALFIFFGAIIAPIFEEFVFRVFLFNAFRKWLGFGWGVAISAFLFGLAHAQGPVNDIRMYLSICFPLMLAGVVLAYVYYRSGRAWASMATHAGFNLLSFWLLTYFPNLAK